MENGWLLAGTTFLASAVEAVEALTIVLAVGVTRSWRSALAGSSWALAVLAAICVVGGPAIVTFIPLGVLRLIVGIFLILFGLAWLRKAILRYSGRKALHDEDAIYAREAAQLRAAGKPPGRDTLGFATAFKAVLLEGLEVAVIVVTFGAQSPRGFLWAGTGALIAVVLITLLGIALRKPAARVPENAMKFVVGIMLTSFGTFWTGEGLGIEWWHADLSIVALALGNLAVSAGIIALARREGRTLERRAA
ncbi:MAG: hypothetical protein NVSMB64_15250 [Candidatus Velthaea sp.]